ncbi:PREDICTED: uncharacterized protein LOC103327491 [Prunus mume]|uniref:Uncharacterized protein LOC103327491 n=1 Tax=Prunus mume TaxID=102107 RepID=A0ABM1LN93_PRUMU|nr:PREDICTED: uncharacterized protein LOC103327491 [Prunus mume]
MERYFKRRFASSTSSSNNVGSSSSRDVDTSLDCVRFLLRHGLPFRGHDESDTSTNKGNYLELLQFLADHDEKVKVVKIIKDMDGAFLSLLVDESHDVSVKEHMAVVFRYVDKNGDVIERFVGIQHVSNTTSNSLKEAIDTLFSREELTLVAVTKGNADIDTFFTSCNSLVNIVGASCKRRDMLKDQLQKDITEALEKDTFPTGRGLNQETFLKRPGDTRWNSHYGTLLSIIFMFKYVVKQLAESNHRFSEVNTELLLCLTCLSPDDSFRAFDKQKLLRFAEFYPQDFNPRNLLALEDQLEIYINHMRMMTDFSQLKGIGSLARKIVEKGLHRTYNYVYLLIKLALTLPVATASVERAFSTMNIVKGPLRNRVYVVLARGGSIKAQGGAAFARKTIIVIDSVVFDEVPLR